MQPDDRALFTQVWVRQVPFPHFVAESAFSPEVADAAYAWLDARAPWQRHVSEFFDQFECNVLDVELPASLEEGLVGPDTLQRLRGRMEALFRVPLADIYSVVAHRLVPGQGIGLHNDEPLPRMESHRAVVHLGPGYADQAGGQLLLFSSNDPTDVACAFRSIHNSAVGFELSTRSHHAVAELDSGVRYTLVYSFWSADHVGAIESPGMRLDGVGWRRFGLLPTRRAPHAIAGDPLARPLRVLDEAGAGRADAAGEAMLPDLVHAYELLREWQCSDAVCLAGLFHGVYGTEARPRALIAADQRDRVRAAIGKAAERLVHVVCSAGSDSLRRALAYGDPSLVEDRRRRTSLGIDVDTLVSLATLKLAHLCTQRRTDELDLVELAEPYLDARVRWALRRYAGDRPVTARR